MFSIELYLYFYRTLLIKKNFFNYVNTELEADRDKQLSSDLTLITGQ